MRLLIGLDRREGGKDAPELARVLCAGQRAKALVVTVLYSEPVHEYARLSGDAAEDAGPAVLAGSTALNLLNRAPADVAVAPRGFAESQHDGLRHIAVAYVDLLVVGSRGYGPLTRVLLGSVSRKLTSEAPCPVLVARRP